MNPMVNKLSNVVTSSFNFVYTKTRLIIEYALIASIIIIAGFTFTLWLEKIKLEDSLADAKTQLHVVQHRLNDVEGVNLKQQQKIEQLQSPVKCCKTSLDCSICIEHILIPMVCPVFHTLHD